MFRQDDLQHVELCVIQNAMASFLLVENIVMYQFCGILTLSLFLSCCKQRKNILLSINHPGQLTTMLHMEQLTEL